MTLPLGGWVSWIGTRAGQPPMNRRPTGSHAGNGGEPEPIEDNMTNDVTGSDRMISLGLRVRAIYVSRNGCPIPSGQLRDEDGVSWRWSDEADWKRGGPGYLVPDLADDVTVYALLAIAEAWNCTTHAAIQREPGKAQIILSGRAGRASEIGQDLAEAVVKVLEAVG